MTNALLLGLSPVTAGDLPGAAGLPERATHRLAVGLTSARRAAADPLEQKLTEAAQRLSSPDEALCRARRSASSDHRLPGPGPASPGAL